MNATSAKRRKLLIGAAVVLGSALMAAGIDMAWVRLGLQRWSSYPSMQAALDAGLADRGWLPPAFPADARDIREWHDLDTNQAAATAQFQGVLPPGWVRMRGQVVVEIWRPPLEGWPSELSGRISAARAEELGFVLLCAGGERGPQFVVAHRAATGVLAYWISADCDASGP